MKENRSELDSGELGLIRLAQKGSEQAFRKILKKNARFLEYLASPQHLAKEVDLTAFDFQLYSDDLLQVAQEELLRSIKSFDLSRKVALKTYCYWKVSHALRDAIKQWTYHTTAEIQDYYAQFEDSIDTTIPTVYYEAKAVSYDQEIENMQSLLEQGCQQLTAREEEIFLLHFHLSIKGKEIAERLELSPAMVSKTLRNAKTKLRKYFKSINN